MGLGRINLREKVVEQLCIGNVELQIWRGAEAEHTICFNGTLGMRMERHHVCRYPYDPRATLVMYSDGISGKFRLDPYLLNKTPMEIASYIFKNFNREYDDATVLVLK